MDTHALGHHRAITTKVARLCLGTTAFVLALLAAPPTDAVRLDPDGQGQALIYPYYTVQSVDGNAQNTYVSIVNQAGDAKILRVRFREGRMGAEVLSFNLFLGYGDVWTGAVVPSSAGGASLVTTDTSCTDPGFAVDVRPGALPAMDFGNAFYTGTNADGAGTGLDRTREGFIEVLEMGTLRYPNPLAQAVAHGPAGAGPDCASVRGKTNPDASAPTGGLSGTFTLINVANGMDFSGNAEALADLASRSYFRPATDPYPSFNASEIDAVSFVTWGGHAYRTVWSRPVDAVSAALMRNQWAGEFVLDAATASRTDVVLTLPTARYYVQGGGAIKPFFGAAPWAVDCSAGGVSIQLDVFDREQRGVVQNISDFPEAPPGSVTQLCGASMAFSLWAGNSGGSVLGSANGGISGGGISGGAIRLPADVHNGWIEMLPHSGNMAANGTRMDSDGTIGSAAHNFTGLPVVGFTVRTFQNGTLSCAGASCQGNYGSAFPLKYQRALYP